MSIITYKGKIQKQHTVIPVDVSVIEPQRILKGQSSTSHKSVSVLEWILISLGAMSLMMIPYDLIKNPQAYANSQYTISK